MLSQSDPIVSYIKERIPFYPWGFLPVLIFIIGHGQSTYNFIALYNLLWGVFFFRVFDDYLCFKLSAKELEKRALNQITEPAFKLSLVFGFLYLSSQILIHSMSDTIVVFLTIFVSILGYFSLRNLIYVQLVSTLKYPLLLYVTASFSGESNFSWVFIASTFFIIRDIQEKLFSRRNVQVEYILMSLLIGLKFLLRILL